MHVVTPCPRRCGAALRGHGTSTRKVLHFTSVNYRGQNGASCSRRPHHGGPDDPAPPPRSPTGPPDRPPCLSCRDAPRHPCRPSKTRLA